MSLNAYLDDLSARIPKCARAAVLAICVICLQASAQQSPTAIDYTDGSAEDGLWVGGSIGHAVEFTAPSQNWTLSKVAIVGSLNPQSSADIFVLEVWDTEMNLIYSQADNPDAYFSEGLSQAEIDLPDMTVPESFYICLFEFSRIFVGTDLNTSGRSYLVSRSPNRQVDWTLEHPQNSTSWMISALGRSKSPPPEVQITSKTDAENVTVTAEFADPDQNLASATMYIIENESGDVLWADHRLLPPEGGSITFNWPRQKLRVTNGTAQSEPVIATNTIDMMPQLAPYLVYSAPCTLKLTPDTPETTALAYFDGEGTFHSLEDITGSTAYYRSIELLDAVSPGTSYGDYVENNLTLIEGLTTISFFKRNVNSGLIPLLPLLLDRSPIQHYTLKMEMVPAQVNYTVEVDAQDAAGNLARDIY